MADALFYQVVLLLHADGVNGSTTFVDSSNSARTLVCDDELGGIPSIYVTHDTSAPLTGTSSIKYAYNQADEDATYITVSPALDAFTGAPPWTVEMQFSIPDTTGNVRLFWFGMETVTSVDGQIGSSYNGYTLHDTISANTKHWLALTYDGTYTRLFFDGVVQYARVGNAALEG